MWSVQDQGTVAMWNMTRKIFCSKYGESTTLGLRSFTFPHLKLYYLTYSVKLIPLALSSTRHGQPEVRVVQKVDSHAEWGWSWAFHFYKGFGYSPSMSCLCLPRIMEVKVQHWSQLVGFHVGNWMEGFWLDFALVLSNLTTHEGKRVYTLVASHCVIVNPLICIHNMRVQSKPQQSFCCVMSY